MLAEISVHDLGVLADLRLTLGPGMTAVTGETGAGKTLVVEAIELLVGGRADSVLVRPGAAEAVIEGRFVDGPFPQDPEAPEDHVLCRVIPAAGGRSRSYLDGRMCTVAALAEWGARLVDLYGQHSHQSLLAAAAQREALDLFAGVDHRPREAARARRKAIDEQLAGLGGDDRARAREMDLLGFQVAEIDQAGLSDPDEDAALEVEEDALAAATAHREAAEIARQAITGDGGVLDQLGVALGAVGGRTPLADPERQLRDLVAAAQEIGAELREAAERLQDDPERLAQVRARRQQLHELTRKYGATLAEVLAYAEEVRGRLEDLAGHERRVAELQGERDQVMAALSRAEDEIGGQRRQGSARLARAVEANLRELAMARARVEVSVGPGAGDEVAFLLSANQGEPALPLSKVASGGELARAMLALRLVLSSGPPTLIFDEVDAGIGGEAAVAVGRALAALAADRQVLVVTHLPQVAAFADHHVAVTKREVKGRTIAEAATIEGEARVAELSRMLSGQPASATARRHAGELLELAAAQRSHRATGTLR